MDVLDQFLTIPMLIFCVVIYVLVQIQRTSLEMILPTVKTSKLWTDLFLPIGPCGTGVILATIFKTYPFPAIMANSWSNRSALGIFCGIFSGYIYKLVKAWIVKKTPETKSEPTDPV